MAQQPSSKTSAQAPAASELFNTLTSGGSFEEVLTDTSTTEQQFAEKMYSLSPTGVLRTGKIKCTKSVESFRDQGNARYGELVYHGTVYVQGQISKVVKVWFDFPSAELAIQERVAAGMTEEEAGVDYRDGKPLQNPLAALEIYIPELLLPNFMESDDYLDLTVRSRKAAIGYDLVLSPKQEAKILSDMGITSFAFVPPVNYREKTKLTNEEASRARRAEDLAGKGKFGIAAASGMGDVVAQIGNLKSLFGS